MTQVLDGALGTLLEACGHALPAPAWSAQAVGHSPDVVAAVHAAYARAGATVHTTATFRTTPWGVGNVARAWTRRAVGLARGAVPTTHTVAGSLAPARDCWAPADAPADAFEHHARQAEVLAEAGCDLLFVETFANVDEAVAATRAAAATGLPVWASLTPGWDGRLLTPAALAAGARRVADAGADVVLVGCVELTLASPWVEALAAATARWGVSTNGGPPGGPTAHGTPGGAARWAAQSAAWARAGAAVVGGCCGTGPAHIRTLVQALDSPPPT